MIINSGRVARRSLSSSYHMEGHSSSSHTILMHPVITPQDKERRHPSTYSMLTVNSVTIPSTAMPMAMSAFQNS